MVLICTDGNNAAEILTDINHMNKQKWRNNINKPHVKSSLQIILQKIISLFSPLATVRETILISAIWGTMPQPIKSRSGPCNHRFGSACSFKQPLFTPLPLQHFHSAHSRWHQQDGGLEWSLRVRDGIGRLRLRRWDTRCSGPAGHFGAVVGEGGSPHQGCGCDGSDKCLTHHFMAQS